MPIRCEHAIRVRDAPRRSYAIAGWHFQIARVDMLRILVYPSSWVPVQRPIDVGTRIYHLQHEAQPETAQHPFQTRRGTCGWAGVRYALRQTDVYVLPYP